MKSRSSRHKTRFGLLLLTLFLSALAFEGRGQTVRVRDLGLTSHYQDTTFGHHKRGRANVAADFDLDGYLDFYMGNPGDESVVYRARPGQNGKIRYELIQVLVTGDLTWSGTSFDYDNDGDYDIFIGCGGNEGVGLDYLFRNDWILDGQVTGVLSFTDVTDEAGIAGPVPDGAPGPIATSSAGALGVDYDGDGDTDIFVNGNNKAIQRYPELSGRNTLWRNNGDGTFTDVSVASGLGVILGATRHSTFFDYDNDGDMDLYEMNYHEANRLWRNNGDGTFTDVTAELSAPGDDLSFPNGSFASAAADFNNDGWEDLIVWMRGRDSQGGGGRNGSPATSGDCGCSECPPFPQQERGLLSPYEDGHAIFINHNGTEFENVAQATNINEIYVADAELGVMGCQVGDVNGDGIPDVYIGNGGPDAGYGDQLFLSNESSGETPVFTNSTALIDFPAVIPPEFPVPLYPYRTHGVVMADVDNDGTTEILVSEGGPTGRPDTVREPNRLFKFDFGYAYLKVHLIGDGIAVSKDAIGSHIAVTVSNPGGESWTVRKTVYGGSSFSACNGYDLNFGLGDADDIESVAVVWPDGNQKRITSPQLTVNSSITLEYRSGGTELKVSGDWQSTGSGEESGFSVQQNYPNPFNPTTTIQYELARDSHVMIGIYDALGREIALLADEFQAAGQRSVVWEGTNRNGKPVSSGLYFYRIVAGEHVEMHRMMLLK